ncbi:MAG: lysylphosphatidylglycerol synthase domain-containing protein [Alphaproteobacteria bacterium]
MKLRLLLALLLGLVVLGAVLARFDLSAVMASLSRVGLGGFILIVAAGLVAEIVLASGIIPLLNSAVPPWAIAASRQLRDSAADVLPITQLGGIAFAARALVLAGLKAPIASAAVIADFTAEAFAQGLYVLVGVVASLSLLQKSTLLSPYVGAMLAGALLLSLGSMGFAIAQVAGTHWIARISEKLFPGASAHTHSFREAIAGIYRRRARLTASMLLQLAGWMASGMWLWVMLKVMGFSTGFWSAIALQALLEGLRSALVFIPAAVGVQEAGYAALAPLFGLAPETGLAVSLLRRARDVTVAVPVLLAWQAVEARRAARGSR